MATVTKKAVEKMIKRNNKIEERKDDKKDNKTYQRKKGK